MDELRDLEPPSTKGVTDKYTLWEYKTPFKRTFYKAFKNAVNAAEADEGGKGYVTLASLAQHLDSKAWAGLESENSPLAKLLLSDAFKNPDKD